MPRVWEKKYSNSEIKISEGTFREMAYKQQYKLGITLPVIQKPGRESHYFCEPLFLADLLVLKNIKDFGSRKLQILSTAAAPTAPE